MDKILPRRASSLAVGIMLFLLEDNDDDEEEEEGEGPLPPGIEVKVRGHSRYWRSRSVLVASLQRRKKTVRARDAFELSSSSKVRVFVS